MTDLVTTDEVINLDDFLNFYGTITPSLLTPTPVEGGTCGLEALLLTQDLDNVGPSSTNDVGNDKGDERSNKREKEKNRQRRYRQRLKDSREELQRQVDALSEQLNEVRQKSAKRKKTDPTDMLLSSSRWIAEAVIQRENRLQSEAVQQRLLAVVEHQAEYIDKLSATDLLPAAYHTNAVPQRSIL